MSPLPLRALAPAKINLGLRLGPLREDGRHELVTVIQAISLADELVLERAVQDGSDGPPAGEEQAQGAVRADRVICPGVDGPGELNLAAAALAAFRRETGWNGPPLRLTIDKRVPIAAGLGGGSGDAAAALRLLVSASGRGAGKLLGLADRLGSDVPALLSPGRWLATGTGARLRELPAPTPPFGVLILPLQRPLSTAAVYAEADRLGLARDPRALAAFARELSDALAGGTALPAPELLANDLEAAARSLCPELDASLERVRASGADWALVSGSGPTAVGLFGGVEGRQRAERAAVELAASAGDAVHARPVAAIPVGAQFGEPQALLSQFPGSA